MYKIINDTSEVTSITSPLNSYLPLILVFLLIFLVLLGKSIKNKGGRTQKNINRKAFINLNSKQSLQVIECGSVQYTLIVGSETTNLIDKKNSLNLVTENKALNTDKKKVYG